MYDIPALYYQYHVYTLKLIRILKLLVSIHFSQRGPNLPSDKEISPICALHDTQLMTEICIWNMRVRDYKFTISEKCQVEITFDIKISLAVR